LTKSVTIQVSEKFEIKSKTRNILSANEFNKELKRARVLIILLVAFMVFGTIVVIGTISFYIDIHLSFVFLDYNLFKKL